MKNRNASRPRSSGHRSRRLPDGERRSWAEKCHTAWANVSVTLGELTAEFGLQIGLGIAASGGLLVAACVTALPTASCAALAEVYLRAIHWFGATAIMAAVLIFFAIPTRTKYQIFGFKWYFLFLLIVTLILFYAAVADSLRTLDQAVVRSSLCAGKCG